MINRNPQGQQDLYQKVTMYLDNELSREAEIELFKELKQNPSYFDLLKQEKSFREFVKSKMHRKKVSPALIQSIKKKIRIHPV